MVKILETNVVKLGTKVTFMFGQAQHQAGGQLPDPFQPGVLGRGQRYPGPPPSRQGPHWSVFTGSSLVGLTPEKNKNLLYFLNKKNSL
jgi:hypothetical protein